MICVPTNWGFSVVPIACCLDCGSFFLCCFLNQIYNLIYIEGMCGNANHPQHIPWKFCVTHSDVLAPTKHTHFILSNCGWGQPTTSELYIIIRSLLAIRRNRNARLWIRNNCSMPLRFACHHCTSSCGFVHCTMLTQTSSSTTSFRFNYCWKHSRPSPRAGTSTFSVIFAHPFKTSYPILFYFSISLLSVCSPARIRSLFNFVCKHECGWFGLLTAAG